MKRKVSKQRESQKEIHKMGLCRYDGKPREVRKIGRKLVMMSLCPKHMEYERLRGLARRKRERLERQKAA